MDGSMMEIGPYRVHENGELVYNEGSWDEFANLLFIDNPVGTGFSYVDTDSYRHELPEMAADVVTFLEKFFKLFPEYEEDDVSASKRFLNTPLTLRRFISVGSLTLVNISLTLLVQCSTVIRTLKFNTNGTFLDC